MKFFYIINKNKQAVAVGKINSERGYLLRLLNFDFEKIGLCEDKLYSIDFDLQKIQDQIENLLKERDSKPLDHPDYNNKFYQEIQLLKKLKYKDKELLLCQTGFDNKLIFLINIYNSILGNEAPYFLIFTNNHREFNDWKKNS